jgi:uncharacterized protein (DUF736 family)
MALKRIGALWTKTDKNKKNYMSGTVEMGALGHINVMIFPNEKQEENHPDYSVCLIVPDEPEKK